MRCGVLAATGAALVWFTGSTATNGRGAVMSYLPVQDSYWVWYAGSACAIWRPRRVVQSTLVSGACS